MVANQGFLRSVSELLADFDIGFLEELLNVLLNLRLDQHVLVMILALIVFREELSLTGIVHFNDVVGAVGANRHLGVIAVIQGTNSQTD